MKKYLWVLGLIIIIYQPLKSQAKESNKTDFSGYLSAMSWLMHESSLDTSLFETLLHNRLNFSWYPDDKFTASLQLRNRLIYGDFVKNIDNYKDELNNEPHFMDLSVNWFSGGAYVLNTTVDRAWLKYTLNKLEITAGRQRINWSQTFVWNPNDLFNVYNFFDFDYAERPGSDALRLQYYTGMASSAEFAVKLDSASNLTAAAKYMFNKWGYDIQLITGYYSSYSLLNSGYFHSVDYVAGMGWSGSILNVSFRGELSYFRPKSNFNDTSGLFYASLSADYMFSSELGVNAEFFYSDIPKNMGTTNFMQFYSGPMSVKNMTFTRYNFFTQASYPVTPLINASMAFMYLYDNDDIKKINGYYLGPSVTVSLSDNLDISAFAQIFGFKIKDKATIDSTFEQKIQFGFIRLKWNF
ncbi:MAG: hypothetical protein JXJ22_18700 [Bacteroidales bacterium]|nr:hypothetical protein [Bacteroidales bacterium]